MIKEQKSEGSVGSEIDFEARDKLVDSNMNLVVSIAESYQGLGVGEQDLIQDGVVGLLRAIETFKKATGGADFYSYAESLIRESIEESLSSNTNEGRVKEKLIESVEELNSAKDRLLARLGRKPTDDEVCDELCIYPRDLDLLNSLISKPASLVNLSMQSEAERTAAPNGADFKIDHEKTSADYLLESQIASILPKLSDIEQQVIKMSFGFDRSSRATLEEIAVELGITKDEAQSIEEASVEKLRRFYR